MTQSFLATFRKLQDSTKNRLHRMRAVGEIDGFVLSYLGQVDEKLPWYPPPHPTRDSVRDYPTDFFAMAEGDVEILAERGELLTRFLVPYYVPEV